MIEQLGHPNAMARRVAFETILEKDADGLERLKSIALHPDREIAVHVGWMLVNLEAPFHFQTLVELLYAANPVVGDMAARKLERYGARAVRPLLEAVKSVHPLVQFTVVGVLERIGSEQAATPLMQLLREADSASLRYTIIQALGRLGDPAAIPLIESFADDPDTHVRQRVAEAIARLRQQHQDT